jgi:hypothetical protein
MAFSAEVTAYSIFELQGTGVAEQYAQAVRDIVGGPVVDELLDRYELAIAEADGPADRVVRLRREVFSDPHVGPVARNIIKLWYVGIWYELPKAWTDRYGALPKNTTFTVTPSGYVEALLWPSIGANPSGAKAPGFGSWATPPQIPTLS